MKIDRRNFALGMSISGLALLAGGCGTIGGFTKDPAVEIPPPKPPQAKMQTLEEAIGSMTALTPRSQGEEELPDFKAKRLGVTDFTGDSKGAPLLSNTLWRYLLPLQRSNKISVVDRAEIERVKKELNLTDSNLAKLTDTEIAEKLGGVITADHLFVASMTEYHSGVQSITLSEQFFPGEIERYTREYESYLTSVENERVKLRKKIDDPGSSLLGTRAAYQQELNALNQQAQLVKTPREYERLLATRPISANISSVGITASIVEIKSTRKIWVFDATARQTSLESANESLIVAMLKSLFNKTPTAQ